MTTILPKDADDTPLPALRLKSNGAHKISSSASTTRNANPFDAGTRVISVFATEDVYINFGDDSVSATTSDHFFPQGVYYDIAIGGDNVGHFTHIAVLQVASGGSVYISEKN